MDFFLELETRVWNALKNGDAQADKALLSEDFLGVYNTGTADREEHAAQLHDGPTITEFTLSDAKGMELADGVVLLTYRATFTRPLSSESSQQETMYITSIWQNRNGIWLNVFSQDTKAES